MRDTHQPTYRARYHALVRLSTIAYYSELRSQIRSQSLITRHATSIKILQGFVSCVRIVVGDFGMYLLAGMREMLILLTTK